MTYLLSFGRLVMLKLLWKLLLYRKREASCNLLLKSPFCSGLSTPHACFVQDPPRKILKWCQYLDSTTIVSNVDLENDTSLHFIHVKTRLHSPVFNTTIYDR
jgi:hypothetical protein